MKDFWLYFIPFFMAVGVFINLFTHTNSNGCKVFAHYKLTSPLPIVYLGTPEEALLCKHEYDTTGQIEIQCKLAIESDLKKLWSPMSLAEVTLKNGNELTVIQCNQDDVTSVEVTTGINKGRKGSLPSGWLTPVRLPLKKLNQKIILKSHTPNQ